MLLPKLPPSVRQQLRHIHEDLEGLRSSVSALDADKPVVVQLERQGKVRYLSVWLEDSQRR